MNALIRQLEMRVWHKHYLLVVILPLVALLFVVLVFVPKGWSAETTVSFVAAALGLLYFLYQQHLQTARFCNELVTTFNRRYDEINNDLQSLLEVQGEFKQEDSLKFVDYFNLCAEEHMFHELGYIYGPIWHSWQEGMKQYAKDPRVVAIWNKEKKTNSYYGFVLPAA